MQGPRQGWWASSSDCLHKRQGKLMRFGTVIHDQNFISELMESQDLGNRGNKPKDIWPIIFAGKDDGQIRRGSHFCVTIIKVMKRELLFKYCTGPCFKEEALDQIITRCFPQGVSHLKILDVGCRNGEWVQALAKRGAHVYGADVCQHSLNEARRRFPLLADSFVQEKAQTLSTSATLGQRKFDFIFCLGTLCYFSKVEQEMALQEMATLLEPQGQLWVGLPRSLSWWQKKLVLLANLLPVPVLRLSAWPFSWLMQLLTGLSPMRDKIYPQNYWRYWGPLGAIGFSTDSPVLHDRLKEISVDLSPLCFTKSSQVYCLTQSYLEERGK